MSSIVYSGEFKPSDLFLLSVRYNWTSLVEGIPGSAVRSFDTKEDAKKSFQESLMNGLVERVQILGERRTLTEDEVSGIPGLAACELPS